MKKVYFYLLIGILWFFATSSFLLCFGQAEVKPLYQVAEVEEILQRLEKTVSRIILTDWRFQPPGKPGGEDLKLDDSDWEIVSPGFQWHQPHSECWFRKKILLPEKINNLSISGTRVVLKVGVDDDGEIYINGKLCQKFYWDDGGVVLTEDASADEEFLVAIKGINGNGPGELLFTYLSVIDEIPSYIAYMREGEGLVEVGDKDWENKLKIAIKQVDINALEEGNTNQFLTSLENSKRGIDPSFRKLQRRLAKKRCIYFIGHSHIDACWLWPRTEGRDQVCVNTFNSVLDMMGKYSELRFTQSSAQLYEWMEEYYPEIFCRIRKKVKERKWEIVGGMWIEPDGNLPCGESFVRQLLYGKGYFRDKFGVDVKVAWTPDSFGYNWNLPQIYRKAGIKYFYNQKLRNNDTTKFPYSLFWWQAPDGTKILAYNGDGWYTRRVIPGKVLRRLKKIRERQEVDELMVVYGMGDHGGGPTEEMIKQINLLSKEETYPEVKFAKAEDYFKEVEKKYKDLPVWNDELYLEYHRGTYTTQAGTKLNNRRSECLLMNAEKFSTWARDYGFVYPHRALSKAWKRLCFNQFHDILPGSSIHQVYVDSEGDFQDIFSIGETTLSNALGKIASHINTTGEGKAIIVFNPLSWQRSDLVELEVSLLDDPEFVRITDSEGNNIPVQLINEGKDVCFIAEDVPSFGYKLYRALPIEAPEEFATGLSVSKEWIETQFYRAEIDPKTGCLAKFYDKKNKKEIIDQTKRGNLIQIYEDYPELYDAWNIGLGELDELDEADEIEVIEKGPVRGKIRISKSYENSTFQQDLILCYNLPWMRFTTTVQWHEEHKLAKVAFPINFSNNCATYEIPYAAIVRRNSDSPGATLAEKAKWEVPAQRWVDYTDETGKYGMSLLNNCKYGFDVKANTLRMTILRAPTFPDPQADQGKHRFSYALYPHLGDWRKGGTVRKGYEFNYPLLVCVESDHRGNLPDSFSFIEAGPENIILTVAKMSERSDATTLRFYEVNGEDTIATLSFSKPPEKCWEVDLMENKLRKLPARKQLSVPIKGYEIKSIKVSFSR